MPSFQAKTMTVVDARPSIHDTLQQQVPQRSPCLIDTEGFIINTIYNPFNNHLMSPPFSVTVSTRREPGLVMWAIDIESIQHATNTTGNRDCSVVVVVPPLVEARSSTPLLLSCNASPPPPNHYLTPSHLAEHCLTRTHST